MRNDTLAIVASVLFVAALGGGGLYALAPKAQPAAIEIPATVVESASRTVIVPILTYHTVRPITPADGPKERYYNTSPELFAKELAWLKDHGYQSVDFVQLVDAILHGGTLPAKPVLLTLDDGTESQYQYAFPALKNSGLTATYFIFTNAIDRPHYITKAQLLEMQAAGMSIQGHTRYHPYLTKQNDADLDAEIAGSKKTLEGWIGKPVIALAYPFGLYDDRVVAKTQASGYLVARALGEGSVHGGADIMKLHSWLMHEDWKRFLQAIGGK